MKKYIIFLLSLFSILLVSQVSYSQIKSDLNLEKGDVAVGGYDPVSYFENKVEKGDRHITTVYQGAHYYFVSQKHLEAFKASPQKYSPAYGGWCAYAMGAKGDKVDVNYETYKIQNGRLFLFYNKFFSNTLEDWEEEGAERLEKQADKNWKKYLAQ
ncbi:YHS domain-containing (seleno)protein [Flammeovirga sp. SubArs3]|uniref:YHS domain-containing (seleno)protein n=1 Tax=Flammeovirga sp. SubArs3 TaxID=2995316 RepID=UPI00248BCA68|nr:YHS domain-containing (seleno)protein [Flammeovirga sp. SubArs3]